MITDKTIKSKNQPKQTNVTWIDLSGKTPVEKHFINGRWIAVSSNGSAGSSNPTEADATKVWQVTPVQKGTETKIETFEIFPEKSIWASSTVHDTQNVDKFNVGNIAIVTINGVTYTSEIQDNDGSSQVVIVTNPDDETLSNTFYITNCEGSIDFDFNNNIPPRPTVASLSVECRQETPIYDYNWAPGVKIPIPTAEDEGKILVVNGVEIGSEEYELAPTQTVTITDEPVVLQNTGNLDKFVEGATVALVIDDATYTGQVVNDGGLYVAIDNNEVAWYLTSFENGGDSTLEISDGTSGTYEVSVSVLEKKYSYEYQLKSSNSNGLSIPPFRWEEGDTVVHYDTLPKVNDIIYFAYKDRNDIIRLFPIVVTSINASNSQVTGTFMPFGNYYVASGNGSDSHTDHVQLSNTTFGTNWQVNIGPVIGGYAVSYVVGQIG